MLHDQPSRISARSIVEVVVKGDDAEAPTLCDIQVTHTSCFNGAKTHTDLSLVNLIRSLKLIYNPKPQSPTP